MECSTKKHEKKRERRKKRHSSPDSEYEWEEKRNEMSMGKNIVEREAAKREDWMSVEMDFASFSSKKEKKKESEANPVLSKDEGALSSRELNPYWRNGGTGLPPEREPTTNHRRSSRDSKDKDLLEKNKSLRDIKKQDQKHKYGYSDRKRESSKERYGDEVRSRKENSQYSGDERTSRSSKHEKSNSFRSKDNSRSYGNQSFKKPEYDEDGFRYDRRNSKSDDNERRTSTSSSASKQRWKKSQKVSQDDSSDQGAGTSKSYEKDQDSHEPSSSYEMNFIECPQKVLSVNEMNMLCSKLIKAELKGDMELAEQLRLQVEKARRAQVNLKNNDEYADGKTREVIVLTETDSKGFVRPLKSIEEERSSTKRKVETHEGNKRVRYFADDDSLTLSEMFEKERFGSSHDQEATFIKLMNKEMSGKNEDAFEETASMENPSKHEKKDWDSAVKKYSQREKAIDNCHWCLDSKNANQDVIVAVRNSVHLCVPSSQSLIEGHCIIVPSNHIPCATHVDEDVWEDIMNLRKNLVKIFEAEGDDVIFFECASNLDKHPHMQLHCVPVPKETGDVAPIYFKKAIMECEMEWSNNKKVIDLNGRNVRKAVPRGLPYFAVDFGMQPGYAHVIEDKRLFPNNFAQEIIGGMLDIDHSKWRKLHRDTPENIQEKNTYLKELLKKNL